MRMVIGDLRCEICKSEIRFASWRMKFKTKKLKNIKMLNLKLFFIFYVTYNVVSFFIV